MVFFKAKSLFGHAYSEIFSQNSHENLYLDNIHLI